MTIRLKEAELGQFSAETAKQQKNLNEVIRAVQQAVNGRDWQSEAARSFETRWKANMKDLTGLETTLQQISKDLKTQEGHARELNKKF